MILNVLQGHLPIASLYKWNFSYSCATFNKISTDRASRGPSAIAEFLVQIDITFTDSNVHEDAMVAHM